MRGALIDNTACVHLFEDSTRATPPGQPLGVGSTFSRRSTPAPARSCTRTNKVVPRTDHAPRNHVPRLPVTVRRRKAEHADDLATDKAFRRQVHVADPRGQPPGSSTSAPRLSSACRPQRNEKTATRWRATRLSSCQPRSWFFPWLQGMPRERRRSSRGCVAHTTHAIINFLAPPMAASLKKAQAPHKTTGRHKRLRAFSIFGHAPRGGRIDCWTTQQRSTPGQQALR